MVIPFIGYLIGLFAVGFLHTILTPVANGLFNASTNTGAVMTLMHAAWDYFPLLYAIVGVLVLILYSQKTGGGPFA